MLTQALTAMTQALVGVPMPKWHGFMQENFGTEAKVQMPEFSSNWACDSDEDEASVQSATAPDPEEGGDGKETEDLQVDEESSTAPPAQASSSTVPVSEPPKPTATLPTQPPVADVFAINFFSIQVPGTPAVEPAGPPAGSKQSVPQAPGPSKPKKPHLSKGYLCLVTPAGRPKAGLTPGQIYSPYCKADLDNTGIPQNMIPSIKGVPDNICRCQFPNCPYHALDKSSVTNHMRAIHTNSMLGCFYCQDPPYGVASAKAWKAHCEHLHPNVPHFWNEFEAVGLGSPHPLPFVTH